MSLKDVLTEDSYDSTECDVVNNFYVPVLKETKNYDRIAGFFTSSSLIISMKGILGLIKNNGHIRLLVSPRLSAEDVEIMNDAMSNPDKYISDLMISELEKNDDDVALDYRTLLAHLIAKKILEIKVVMIVDDDGKYVEATDHNSIFHMKIGIMTDSEGNKISFSGSINETFNAWNKNAEEFKVFRSWEDSSNYCEGDQKRFNNYWDGLKEKTRTIELPDAVREKYISIADNTDFEAAKKHIENIKKKIPTIQDMLFWYQKEAIEKWMNNGRRLLFSMATGTGKTMTALAAVDRVINENSSLLVIATPQSALSQQWLGEIEKLKLDFGKCLMCDSSNPKYKLQLDELISRLNLGVYKKATILTTHASSYSDSILYAVTNRLKRDRVKTIFIGDEVHGLGSKEQRKALLEEYDYRIGLSATPSRWFDDEGSKILSDYFGKECYEFGIDKALIEINPLTDKSFLTPYYYYPIDVYLTNEEDYKYEKYTEKIKKLSFSDEDDDLKKKKERLLEQRADLIKSAENKIWVFEDLVSKLKAKGRIEDTIVFTSPQQIKKVLDVLYDHEIIAYPLTKDQGNKPEKRFGNISERQYILNSFRDKTCQVIVAIKCMDEGIDIPSADTAILMSSTTNPREYIQRIGRVIRRHKDKKSADIYDLVTKSTDCEINKSIQKNELKREEYIAQYSRNSIDALIKIYGGD